MGTLGYNKRNMLRKKIVDRLTVVFDQQPIDPKRTTKERIDQAGENILNIFDQFLEDCFA